MKAIYINGKNVCVTDEVYTAFKKGERKDKYLTSDLKHDRFLINRISGTVEVIPSREDSYERLTNDCRVEFADESKNTEDEAITTLLIEEMRDALATLTDTEKQIIYGLFFEDKTAKRIARELGISVTAICKRKRNILKKLRKILEK